MILGIDVSKARLDAALWLPEQRKWYATKASNDVVGIARLRRWACDKAGAGPDQLRVMLEANPKRVRDFAKGLGLLTKTDAVDARALARYGEVGEALPWQPPAPAVRQLKALLARLHAVEDDLQRESNRWEQAQIADTPGIVRDSLQRGIGQLQQEKRHLLKAIDDHYDQHPKLKADRELLQSIPAVGPASSSQLLCLLRGRNLRSARQAAALTGLVPLEHRSGTSVNGKARLSKQGNSKLRATLYMASVVALSHNRELRAIYDRLLAAGKSKMAALGALSRHLVHIAFGILKHQQPYNLQPRPRLQNHLTEKTVSTIRALSHRERVAKRRVRVSPALQPYAAYRTPHPCPWGKGVQAKLRRESR